MSYCAVEMTPKRVPHGTPLMERVAFYSIPEPNTGCWFWLGAVNGKEGVIKLPRQRQMRMVHELVYEHNYGTVGEKDKVIHKCGQHLCVNPDHLEVKERYCRRPGYDGNDRNSFVKEGGTALHKRLRAYARLCGGPLADVEEIVQDAICSFLAGTFPLREDICLDEVGKILAWYVKKKIVASKREPGANRRYYLQRNRPGEEPIDHKEWVRLSVPPNQINYVYTKEVLAHAFGGGLTLDEAKRLEELISWSGNIRKASEAMGLHPSNGEWARKIRTTLVDWSTRPST